MGILSGLSALKRKKKAVTVSPEKKEQHLKMRTERQIAALKTSEENTVKLREHIFSGIAERRDKRFEQGKEKENQRVAHAHAIMEERKQQANANREHASKFHEEKKKEIQTKIVADRQKHIDDLKLQMKEQNDKHKELKEEERMLLKEKKPDRKKIEQVQTELRRVEHLKNNLHQHITPREESLASIIDAYEQSATEKKESDQDTSKKRITKKGK